MTAKHTPGPWEKLDTCFERNSDPLFWVCGVKKGGIRVAEAVGVGREQAEANAALIAAAPELLEALKRINQLANDFGQQPDYSLQAQAIAQCAIAKAEGR